MAGMMPTDDTTEQTPPPAANDNAQQASPEEQAQYNRFVGRAMELINKLAPQIHEMLKGGSDAAAPAQQPDQENPTEEAAPGEEQDQGSAQQSANHGANGPAQGLAQATVMVLARVGSAAEQAGEKISPDVLFHGGTEIFEQLAEESDALGYSDYANDRDQLEAAYYLTIDLATQQMAQSGEIDQAGAKQAMDQLQQMDANGELERIFKELAAKDKGGGGAEPANDNAPQGGGMMPKGA